MKCTTCHTLTDHLYYERWNCNLGYIIKPGEKLCFKCAAKRPGFRSLADINNERQSKK